MSEAIKWHWPGNGYMSGDRIVLASSSFGRGLITKNNLVPFALALK